MNGWTSAIAKGLMGIGLAGLSTGLVLAQSSGNAAKGKTLVESGGCLSCHRIGDKGPHTAPELTDIGDKRTPARLTASLETPDAEVLPENRYVRVTGKDGSTDRGRILNQDAFSIQMINTKDQLKTYMKSSLKDYEILDKGLMPSMKGKLSEQDIADVVAYLSTLKAPE